MRVAGNADYTLRSLTGKMLMDSGGPRDLAFRMNILRLVNMYNVVGIKSENLPNDMLAILQEKVIATINDLKQVCDHEGIAYPKDIAEGL